ncbi:unnamed protein product [Urochloa humidicola]
MGFPLYIASYIVGLGFPARLAFSPPVLVLFWSAVGGSGGSRSGVGVGKAKASSLGDGPRRIRWSLLFLLNVSGGILVVREWCLMMVGESVVCDLGASVIGGFGAGVVFVESILCVSVPFLHGFHVAGSAPALTSCVGPEANDIATGGQRSLLFPGSGSPESVGIFCYSFVIVGVHLAGDDLWSSIYRCDEKSGRLRFATDFGGSIPLRGNSSSSDLGWIASWKRQTPRCLAIRFCRVVQRLKCTSIGCAAQDGNKNFCGFAREEVGFRHYAPAGGGEEHREEDNKDLFVLFVSSEGVLVKWVVITNLNE